MKTKLQPYRFHCEELTAQTDSEERPTRQRWFQNVILDNENQAELMKLIYLV